MNNLNSMLYAIHDRGGSASLADLCGLRDTLATAKEIVDAGLATLDESGASPVLRLTPETFATMKQGKADLVGMMFDAWEAAA